MAKGLGPLLLIGGAVAIFALSKKKKDEEKAGRVPAPPDNGRDEPPTIEAEFVPSEKDEYGSGSDYVIKKPLKVGRIYRTIFAADIHIGQPYERDVWPTVDETPSGIVDVIDVRMIDDNGAKEFEIVFTPLASVEDARMVATGQWLNNRSSVAFTIEE